MGSIARDVKSLESDERRLYESVVGHVLHDNQRVIIHVIELGKAPDEAVRRKAREELRELCREATKNREEQGISVDEADRIVDEAIRAVRLQQFGKRAGWDDPEMDVYDDLDPRRES